MGTAMSCPRLDGGRNGVSAAPKALAFSIERIMSKTSEPKGRLDERRVVESSEGMKMLGLCSPIPCMIPLQPFSYDLQAKALMNYSEFWKANFRGTLCTSAAMCKANCGMCGKIDSGLKHSLLPGRVIKPQVIHQAVAMPTNGSLYYFNYLDSAYHQSELLSGHLFSSALANSQAQASLSAHQKLLLLENAKLASASAEKFPTPQYPHKEHLPGQLDQIVKENHNQSSEKNGVKAHSKLNNSSMDGKPKNFTCEVCGKVNYFIK